MAADRRYLAVESYREEYGGERCGGDPEKLRNAENVF